jgi:hypothetical protein
MAFPAIGCEQGILEEAQLLLPSDQDRTQRPLDWSAPPS